MKLHFDLETLKGVENLCAVFQEPSHAFDAIVFEGFAEISIWCPTPEAMG